MSASKARPRRSASPEQLAANRANARKSTGPLSDDGKKRSRENALKHGLTGDGVVQTPALESAYQQRSAAYQDELRPATPLEHDLVRNAALGASRLELARRRDFAAARVRQARADFDRRAALDAAIAALPENPARSLRTLTADIAGIDWLIDAWTDLHDAITDDGRYWSDDQLDRAFHLLGMSETAFWKVAGRAVARAHFALGSRNSMYLHSDALTADRMHGRTGALVHQTSRITIDPPSREEARATLRNLAESHIARLSALRRALEPLEMAAPCPIGDDEGRLWQRYETAARQSFHGSLARLRTAQADRRRAGPATEEESSTMTTITTEPESIEPAAPPPDDALSTASSITLRNEPNSAQLVMMKSDVEEHEQSMKSMRERFGAMEFAATHPEQAQSENMSLYESLGGHTPEYLVGVLRQRLRDIAASHSPSADPEPESAPE